MAAAIIGVLDLVVGAGCRFFVIPRPPAPDGACLLLAMTVGFVIADHVLPPGRLSCNWIHHEIDDRHRTGLRAGFRLPSIWNTVSGTAADPWRLLVMTMTIGYIAVDRWMASPAGTLVIAADGGLFASATPSKGAEP